MYLLLNFDPAFKVIIDFGSNQMKIPGNFCFQAVVGYQAGAGGAAAQVFVEVIAVTVEQFQGTGQVLVDFFGGCQVLVKGIVKIEMGKGSQIGFGEVGRLEMHVGESEPAPGAVGFFHQPRALFDAEELGIGVLKSSRKAEFSSAAADIKDLIAGTGAQEGRCQPRHFERRPVPSGHLADGGRIKRMESRIAFKPGLGAISRGG